MTLNLRQLWATARRWYEGHSARDRRVLAAVGAAIGLSLVYVIVVERVRDYRRDMAQAIDEGRTLRDRYEQSLSREPQLRAERDDLRRRLDQAKERLLPGDSATLGAAALQERANALAAERGITIQSTQVMKEEPADPFRRVTVRLTLSGELRPFAELLSGLEYGPYQVTLPFVEVSRRGAVANAKGPRTLTSTFEVSGYVLDGSKRRKAAAEAPEGEGEGEGRAALGEDVGPPTPPADDVAGPPAPEGAAPLAAPAVSTTVPAPGPAATAPAPPAKVPQALAPAPPAKAPPPTVPGPPAKAPVSPGHKAPAAGGGPS